MSNESCAIIPQKRNKKTNTVEDSKLFKDLLSFTNNNRTLTIDIYYRAINPSFIEANPNIKLDNHGEPIIQDLIKKGLKSFIKDKDIRTKIASDYHFFDKEGNSIIKNDTTENYTSMVKEAIDFNQYSDFKNMYTAVLRKNKIGDIYIDLVETNNEVLTEASKMKASYNLNNKIRTFLSKNGISTGALNNLDLSLRRTGVIDFSVQAVNGIRELIRISRGSRGEVVLPEEFSHFIIDSMEKSPLMNRLINLMKDKSLSNIVLGEEYTDYQNQPDDTIAKEAVARLLIDKLYKTEGISTGIWSNLLNRVEKEVKNKYGNLNSTEVSQMLKEYEKEVEGLIKELPNKKIEAPIKQSVLSHIDSTSNKLYKAIENLFKLELKRYSIYKNRLTKSSKPSNFEETQRNKLNYLEGTLISSKYYEGLSYYINNMVSTLDNLNKRIEELNDISSNRQKASLLRDIDNYIQSYRIALESIDDIYDIVDEENQDLKKIKEEFKSLTDSLKIQINNLERTSKKESLKAFAEFIYQYIPEEGIKSGDRIITREEAEQLITNASKDTSIVNTYLCSAAESTNSLIKIVDKIIKERKFSERQRATEYKKRILALAQKAKEAGITSFNFMFQKDSEGNYTNKYVEKYNYDEFKEARSKFMTYLNTKYKGKNIRYGQDKVAYMSEKLKWESENMKGDNPSDKYLNKDFPKGAELEYYNEFMSILKELKDLLPDSTFAFKDDNYAIQIRSSLVDRLKGSPMTEWGSQLKEVVKDSFIRREDETEYGVKSVLQDLKGNEVYSLPILFTNEIQGKDLSHDTNSTLYMFADMAVFYDEMSKIVDALELGRSLVNNPDENYGMKVTDTVGGKTKVSVINELGKSATQVITKKNSNIAVEYDNLVNSQVYGKRSKDEGTIGNTSIDKQKAANFATKFAGLSQLALNFIAASAASLQDMVNVNSEAMGGQFFKFKHLLKADTTYFKNIGSRISNMGNAAKSNKLDLFIEKYDIKHDFENESKYPDFAKSKLAKLLSTNSLYFLMSIGTDFGEVRTSLAKAYNTKVRLADGTITNLFDGQEVVPIDPEHPSYGYKLEFPEGAVIVEEDKENNKNLVEISKAEDYSLPFSQMTLAINQRLYGIYNDADKNALKRTAEGKLLLQYRDWLVPAINRRYFSRGNNLMLNIDNDEGYYLTTLKFFKQLIKDSKELQTLAIKYTWSNLDSTQISNLKRAAAEVVQLGLVFVVLGTLKSRWKERDNPYALKLATLLARRLKTEMLAIMPTPSIITEFFRIVKEPIAAVDPIESLLTVFTDIFNPSKYEELQSGPYKGHSKLYRDVMNSPLIPFNSTIRRTLHPENALTYFNQ